MIFKRQKNNFWAFSINTLYRHYLRFKRKTEQVKYYTFLSTLKGSIFY